MSLDIISKNEGGGCHFQLLKKSFILVEWDSPQYADHRVAWFTHMTRVRMEVKVWREKKLQT